MSRSSFTSADQTAALQLACGYKTDVITSGLRRSHPDFVRMIETAQKLGADIAASSRSYLEHKNLASRGSFAGLRSSFQYPIMIFLIFWIIGLGMIIFVVPNFKQFYLDGGRELPLLTRFFADLGPLGFSVYVLLALLLSVFPFVFSFLRTMHERFNTYRACLLTQHLIAGGVDLTKAFSEVSSQSGKLNSATMGYVKKGIENKADAAFVKAIVHGLASEIEQHTASFEKSFEPVAIIVIGGFIGAFIVAMYLPIFNIAGGM